MSTTTHRKNHKRSITVDFQSATTYQQLREDGHAFVEFVVACITTLGFQLLHKCGCPGGCALTRHSSYMRVRLDKLVIWRLQCKPLSGGVHHSSAFCPSLSGDDA
jgi:hypothetical protein